MSNSRSYQRKANWVLGASVAGFAIAMVLQNHYGSVFWTDLLLHVTQAALIGGLADWFAVTALFEKPLGIPWHTALIPRNRAKLIDSLAHTVERDFLSVGLIKQRLSRVRLSARFVTWADSTDGRQQLAVWAVEYAEQAVSSIDKQALAARMAAALRQEAATISLQAPLSKLGRWLVLNRKDEELLQLLLNELVLVMMDDKTAAAIHRYLSSLQQQAADNPGTRLALWLAEQTDSLNLRDLSQAIQQDLTAFLLRLKDIHHPLRRWLRKHLIVLVRKLSRDQEFAAALTTWQHQAAGRLPLEDMVRSVLEAVLDPALLRSRQGRYHAPLAVWIMGRVERFWASFKQDGGRQRWLDNHLHQALGSIIDSQRRFVSTVVRQALGNFSNKDLSRFVQDKVGDDLAWIRINGSLVGGLIGLGVFLLLRLVIDPYIVPVVRAWFA